MKQNNNRILVAVGLILVVIAAVATVNWSNGPFKAEPRVGTVLITGANRGIGLAFATQYAERGWQVIATHRRDTTPDTLQALMDRYDNVSDQRLDVLDHDGIDALAQKLQDTPIDLLINNAAIMGTGDPASAQTFGTLKHELFQRYMQTNALGPIKVVEAFFPHVAASEIKTIVNISSSSGSLSSPHPNSRNMWYRASKTALNGLMVSMAQSAKERGVTVVMFEPGWTWTGQNEELRQAGQRDPEENVALMIETIDGLTLEDTARFLKNDGSKQPW